MADLADIAIIGAGSSSVSLVKTRYLEACAEKFGIRQHVTFNATVEAVEKSAGAAFGSGFGSPPTMAM